MYTGVNTADVARKILQETDDNKKNATCEAFVEQFISDLHSDDEPPRKSGHYALYAYLNGDVDAFCVALTGWSMRSLLARAGVTEDIEGVLL